MPSAGHVVFSPYYQAWLGRLLRKYNIVINQTKFIDLDQQIRIQEQATAIVKAASMIAKPITASTTPTIFFDGRSNA